ncbi:13304_t:CDS:2 [Cetraspora pellucida]|uniref:13304_t:CDS:1 n=1 Tax=Cetraspora pellucida TaxID=1433469 RepID=A0A9N9ENG0_9GLOM|nr:13304_t:CDS:2 [Cetraspora pellucida]
MSAIITKIIGKYNLSSNMSNCKIVIASSLKNLEEEIIREIAK